MAVLCRLCHKHIYDLKPKLLFKSNNHYMIASIKSVTGLSLIDEEHLPRHICNDCLRHLRLSLKLRERCQWNQKLLAQKFKTPATETSSGSEPDSDLGIPIEVPIAKRDTTPKGISMTSAGDSESTIEKLTNEMDILPLDIPINIEKASESLEVTSLFSPKSLGFECNQCSKFFKTAENLRIHQLRHSGTRNFACSSCERRFVTKHLMRLHERVRHFGERPYSCKFCQAKFCTSSARGRHERVQHIRDLRFQCEKCGKQFNTKTCLNKHMVIHNGEKHYRCDLCSVSFSRTDQLKVHCRTLSHKKKTAAKGVDSSNSYSQKVLLSFD